MFAGKTRIYAPTAPIDLRRSVDGLAAAARDRVTTRKAGRCFEADEGVAFAPPSPVKP